LKRTPENSRLGSAIDSIIVFMVANAHLWVLSHSRTNPHFTEKNEGECAALASGGGGDEPSQVST
jgi:hypothetical protein